MNKYGILNSSIAKVLADLGHTDKICIGDCEPLFIEVVKEVAKNMQIEKIYLAPETASKNPKQWEALKEVFPEDKVEWVMLKDHEQLKAMEKDCKTVIRTGEVTPFSNIILQSGVIF